MSDIVIAAENLSKRYLVGHQTARRERYTALRDVLAGGARSFARKAVDFVAGRQIVQGDEVEEFWALRDVNFEVRRGEVLGIIGRNGAGKSTLLKILSRITEPSAGRVTLKGRVASLLEVGTGFHPELTGRENIYLNGAVLGMSRAEVRRKFDEIVAFADVERFLDTPVKRYSSGMYVRLAFAVAAHLEPEIFLIDEVLAVGDAEFQKKCLGKIGEVAGGGRTVLFVSHNMSGVAALCTRALLLANGGIEEFGNVDHAIASYLSGGEASDEFNGRSVSLRARVARPGTASFDSVSLEFDVTLRGPLANPNIGIGLDDGAGRRIATLYTDTIERIPTIRTGEARRIKIVTEPVRLSPGTLFVKISVLDEGHNVEMHENALQLIVPNYKPFEKVPQYWPQGPLLVKVTICSKQALDNNGEGDCVYPEPPRCAAS